MILSLNVFRSEGTGPMHVARTIPSAELGIGIGRGTLHDSDLGSVGLGPGRVCPGPCPCGPCGLCAVDAPKEKLILLADIKTPI